ncbi:DUF3099 domain-containing protein [Cellulomonas palmilytica]|uniref:DUF3099 domain-containing protein n=1 Tax=Cellulomonas palmilytica TaxID=2608402 RepID=UPI001F485218|nr:DUF3099 domain-containing protein [Cellulomonas palmilytica]UJP38846.1 DUF3099 domain-containing protein [Cellulomonas palmilytica]
MRSRRREEPVQRITAAPEPLGEDVARRQRRYLAQMGIRIVCFVLAIVTWSHVPTWVSLVLVVAAVVLPYVAVIFANAGRERRDEMEPFVDPREIGPGGRPAQLGDTPDDPAGGRP